eukprot:jgi/Bigna1/84033/fgenesh1_pg.121_\
MTSTPLCRRPSSRVTTSATSSLLFRRSSVVAIIIKLIVGVNILLIILTTPTPGSSQRGVLSAVAAASSSPSTANVRRGMKVPKGSRDLGPEEMLKLEHILDVARTIFKRHGAVSIETPVFELRETLLNKYGEDSKLIYNLEVDQGGELLSLRYDLTVPLARYAVTHNVERMKRLQIGKVYRRDNPTFIKGRFREFYQCDFDIIGTGYSHLSPDAEVIRAMSEVLGALGLNFTVKVNHRALLQALCQHAQIPDEKFLGVSSCIDKLDKSSLKEVQKELVESKGIDATKAEILLNYTTIKGTPADVLRILESNEILMSSSSGKAKEALRDLHTVSRYLKAFGCGDEIEIDLSLARGLDYYTGLIFEAVLRRNNSSSSSGGSAELSSGKKIPAVGCSIGIERILSYLLSRDKMLIPKQKRPPRVLVLIASIGENVDISHRMCLCGELWRRGVAAEFLHLQAPKPRRQLEYALKNNVVDILLNIVPHYIPFVAFLGEEEIVNNTVSMRDLSLGEQIVLDREVFLDHIIKLCSERNYIN